MADADAKPAEEKVETKSEKKVETKSNDDEAADHKTFSGKSFKDVDHFVNEDKQYLFCKTWMPKSEPKALLMILLGYAEYHDYFSDVAKTGTELGMLVFSHDYVGHGESEGIRADVTGYEVFIRDALQHIKIMKEKYPHLPLYLFGHSTGGGLAIILAGENPDLFKGIILCAPLIKSNALMTKPKLLFWRPLSMIIPQVDYFALHPEALTRNPEEIEKYKNDPLIFHGQVKLRMAVQLSRIGIRTQELFSEITAPVLVLQGEKDMLCDISGSEEFMSHVKSEDKTIKVYEGSFHEPFCELEDVRQKFFHDMKEWLQKHLSE